jgi:AraC-like DNA-binding protein
MTSTAGDPAWLRFSTRAPCSANRLPGWYEVCGRSVARRACRLSDTAGQVDIAVAPLALRHADARLSSGACIQRVAVSSGFTAQRTSELLADGNDDICLNIQESGRSMVSQLGREAIAAPGAGFLTSNADVSTVVLPAAGRFTSIALSRKPMLALVPGLEGSFAGSQLSDSGILRLLIAYLDILSDEAAVQTPELQRAAATHIYDLCALAIGATRDGAELARGRGLRVARLRAIKSDIAHNLAHEGLSVRVLARRQNVTPRYVRKLFESEDTTFTRYVLGLRLERVYRMLADPRYAHRTIGALAYDCGFGDLSTFNRAFRRRYGATPSDVRAAGCSQ